MLATPSTIFVWQGALSPKHEQDSAISASSLLSASSTRPVVVVNEWNEPADFWKAFGGESRSYYVIKKETVLDTKVGPRLFLCTNASGRVDIEEEVGYYQLDLVQEICAVLDDSLRSISFLFTTL